jgi:hypothetical protein
MLTFIVNDIKDWQRHLLKNGVKLDQAPREASYLKMKTMLFKDPEGYVVEVLEFIEKSYGH